MVATSDYPVPPGLHAIDAALLDLRPDVEIDQVITNPRPVTDDKNVWFFWHSGFAKMHPHLQRNVRAWHRKLTRRGWVVRVVDLVPGSLSNVDRFLDVNSTDVFPRAFIDGTLGGDFSAQHSSDLVRFPLLVTHGGVYADAGMLQIGDLDRLWSETVANPGSPYEVLSYDMGMIPGRTLANYFLCSSRSNSFFQRCHRLFLALWAEQGGKTSTDGMYASPLLRGLPLLECEAYEWDGRKYSAAEATQKLTDYIIQGQAISMVMGLVDDEDGWNGPKYVKDHVYAIEFMVGAQLINELTAWNGKLAFDLMSLKLPTECEEESLGQKRAREIVEACLTKSFGFKLATGMIVQVMGDTLGSLWRKHEGSDNVPGTFAHWLRHGMTYWCQDKVPATIEIEVGAPFKRGSLLEKAADTS